MWRIILQKSLFERELMILKPWDSLPQEMQCDEVRKYYDILAKHKGDLIAKRGFDIVASAFMLVLLSPVLVGLSAAVGFSTPGGVFFLQERVTAYDRHFKIFKFRTMVADAEKLGSQLTVSGDKRITKVGKMLRNTRLDELPQLINVLLGDMTFVGTRPEVPRYVAMYTPEMLATLLLPAGITSEASIMYKDEYRLLNQAENVDKAYAEKVLPGKMKYNLMALEEFSLYEELRTMIKTVLAVCGKKY